MLGAASALLFSLHRVTLPGSGYLSGKTMAWLNGKVQESQSTGAPGTPADSQHPFDSRRRAGRVRPEDPAGLGSWAAVEGAVPGNTNQSRQTCSRS